jgi:hypothetical protein
MGSAKLGLFLKKAGRREGVPNGNRIKNGPL